MLSKDCNYYSRVLLNHIKNNKLDSYEIMCLTNLYLNYSSYYDKVCEDGLYLDSLIEYENKIYTVNGKVLNDKDRIKLEINRIGKTLNTKNIDLNEVVLINDEIKIIKKLISIGFDKLDKNTILYIKKEITLIQSKLGLRCYFIGALFETMYDVCSNFDLSVKSEKRYLKNNI